MNKIIAITLLACALVSIGTSASLITGSVSYNHNIGGVPMTIDPANVGSTGFSSYQSNDEDLYAQFGTGYSMGRIDSGRFRGKSKLNSRHRVDNIVITNTNTNLPETSVGEFHASYFAHLTESEPTAASSFRFSVSLAGGSWDFSHLFYAPDFGASGGLSGQYSRLFDFTVNQPFSIDYTIQMIIKNREVTPGYFAGSGGYKFALGGSPVFILPEGYTANSLDGTIVDNQYVGFNPFSTNTTQVPEPSTIAIFALGVIGIATRRLKKCYIT